MSDVETTVKNNNNQPEQLVLDLPHRAALNAEDFLVSSCNKAAVDLIDIWPNWPHHCVLISGPAGCGKTHLVNVWRMRSNAELLDASTLDAASLRQLSPETKGVVLEDIDKIRPYENAFFHLINLAKEQSFHILTTAQSMPGEWDITLPDLRSRLRSLATVSIGTPDEALLKTMLVKLFADRQIDVAPQVIDYVSLRMNRSMEWVCNFVEQADKAALAAGRKVSRKIASDVIEQLQDHN